MVKRSSDLTTIEIRKDVANLVHSYCVFNNLKMRDFVTQVLEEHLTEFKVQLKEMAKLRS